MRVPSRLAGGLTNTRWKLRMGWGAGNGMFGDKGDYLARVLMSIVYDPDLRSY